MNRGGAREKNGRFYARARYGRAKRLELRVPWAKSLEEAEARGEIIAKAADELLTVGRRDLVRGTARELAEADTARRLETVQKTIALIVSGAKKAGASADITFEDWSVRYTNGELAADFPDHVRAKEYADDVSRLKAYILPHVGEVLVTDFTLAHAETVMSRLPEKLQPATRRHVAQIVSRLLNLAVFPGKLVAVSPIPRGWLPRIKSRRHYSCLFPREEAMLLRCGDIAEAFRLFCGVLSREGMREAELLDCGWEHWNLDEGTFLATKTKTGDPRMWAVRPDTAEAMRVWKERSGHERPFAYVAALGDRTKLAEKFRAALAAAGVTRAELFATTKHTGRLRAHDMRATFVTVSLAEGKSEAWIRDRTAHKSTNMIDRYRRQARQFAELKLGSLVDLVEALGWGKAGGRRANGTPRHGENGLPYAAQAEVAEWQTQRTQNPLGGPEESSSAGETRGKDTCRSAANGASPTLPPPLSQRYERFAADQGLLGDGSTPAPVVAAAVGLDVERVRWNELDGLVFALERETVVHRDSKPENVDVVRPPTKAKPRLFVGEQPARRRRGGRS